MCLTLFRKKNIVVQGSYNCVDAVGTRVRA
jgi:hypothetical protein